MPPLKQKLRKELENAKRVAVLGIGSELRGDDTVGLLVLKHLRSRLKVSSPGKKQQQKMPAFKLFNGGTAPENLTGEIRRFKPSHLIMIDAVDMGKKPGTIALVDLKKTENTAFLTHKLPVKLMLDYMAAEMSFTTIFIGIQPRSLEFEGKISKPVIRAGRQTADWLLSTLQNIGG